MGNRPTDDADDRIAAILAREIVSWADMAPESRDTLIVGMRDALATAATSADGMTHLSARCGEAVAVELLRAAGYTQRS